jgi:hypothetical protein
MIEGRKEKRDPLRLQVLLYSLGQPLLVEQATTENINSFGMRLQTQRPWELGTIVLLKSLQDQLLARATVIYCKALQSKTFGLGLKFLPGTDEWTAP